MMTDIEKLLADTRAAFLADIGYAVLIAKAANDLINPPTAEELEARRLIRKAEHNATHRAKVKAAKEAGLWTPRMPLTKEEHRERRLESKRQYAAKRRRAAKALKQENSQSV